MMRENYDELINYLDQLGYSLSPRELANLKRELRTEDRKFFLEVTGSINDQKYRACFMLVRPKYENYFAIREYQFSLQNEDGVIKQVFPVGYEHPFHPDRLKDPITKNAAFNLISGRAVYFNEARQWSQLDFKQSDENGSYKIRNYQGDKRFDLEAILGKYPIRELEGEDSKKKLFESVKEGNMVEIAYKNDVKEEIRYLVANPRFKSVVFYDEQKQLISNKNKLNVAQRHSVKIGKR